MRATSIWILAVALDYLVVGSELRVEVYEYFDNVHASSLDDAREACEMRGGKLAIDPNFDDWDNYVVSDSLDTNILLDTYFAVSVKKTNGVWKYADGTEVDMTSSQALTLRELDSGAYGSYSYDCALWNPWEPFFIPSMCTDNNAFICTIPVTLYTKCEMEALDNTRFVGSWSGSIDRIADPSEDDCISQCAQVTNDTQSRLPCWAVEYDTNSRRCTHLLAEDKPKMVPETQSLSGWKTYMKNCKMVAAFEENTCSVLCKCNTQNVVVIPTDEEEYKEFVEAAVQKNIRELTVPTSNLSATKRKKSSAKDQRQSSTGMGALGIALLSLVFGGLLGLDLLSLCTQSKPSTDTVLYGELQKA